MLNPIILSFTLLEHIVTYYIIFSTYISKYMLCNISGHYRPAESHLKYLLEYCKRHGVDLKNVEVDVQRVCKIARQMNKGA